MKRRWLSTVALSSFDPPKKLTKVNVLYMEDGGLKRCGRCVMFLKNTSECSIHGPGVKVDGENGVCYLYVHGKPMTAEEHPPMKLVTFKVSGYGAKPKLGGYSCGSCEYGGGSHCLHPCLDGFAIDNTGGCCNAWEGNESDASMVEQIKKQRGA